jgi:excisionase family DNA binding protein
VNIELAQHPRGLSIPDAAKYAGISRTTIYRLARKGELPLRKLMGRSVVLRDDLDRLLGVTASGEM